jgi:SAM-dependent methyltransferase
MRETVSVKLIRLYVIGAAPRMLSPSDRAVKTAGGWPIIGYDGTQPLSKEPLMIDGSATPVLAHGFTAHNVVLDDGTQTRPDSPVLAETAIAQAALRFARTICPPSPHYHPRVADLGCLEGGYAVEFARAGYDVLGIEARTESIARCHHVRRETGLTNLEFVQDDVRNIERYGRFDIVFCCGLLYHLDHPAAFLRTLGDVTGKLLLLHTHYAEDTVNPLYALSQLVEHEGLLGRWYTETPPSGWESHSAMESSLWASWLNTASFWPLKRHLLKAVHDAGFAIVCEQFDALDDLAEDPYVERHSRSMFVGVKSPA